MGKKEFQVKEAYRDALTGLPNKKLFHDRLAQALSFAKRKSKVLAVLFMMVDNLKIINDTLGKKYGDEFLLSVATRLKGCLRKSDTVARPGRDEFMVLLTEITRAEDAAVVAQKIFEAMDLPFRLSEHELFVTANIGVSLFPHDGTEAPLLIRSAYTAMQSARESGRNTYKFFDKTMNDRAFERMVFTNSLRHAIKREEFVLHYQPQIDLYSGKVTGMEALVRWDRPGEELVYPKLFIRTLEETGLIIQLGEWVLKKACEQKQKWQKGGLKDIPVAVNISARQFHQKDIIDTVRRATEETGVEPGHLELELTESVFVADPENATVMFGKLRDMGVRISIDDFGTGYSSLCYLKNFPADKLKIVESFFSCMDNNKSDLAIIKTIVSLAHSLNMKVIAEGVELEEHLDWLRSVSCDEYQGNIFSRPVPPDEMAKFL